MSKGWQIKKLGEVCRIEKVQGIHRGLPYIGLEHIESNTARFIGSPEPRSVKSSTFRFTQEHVLYGRLRPYLNKAHLPNFEGHCSTEIYPLKPSRELLREWLLRWLLSDTTCQKINKTCRGARMPRAKMGELMEFEIPVPLLEEQRRIINLVDEVFTGLAKAKENAEKNLQNAHALFESHLESVFTNRGLGWNRKPLGSLCRLVSGQHIDAKDYNTEGKGIGYLTGPSDFGFLNPIITKWSEHPKRTAKRGDILITVKGSGVGKINLLDQEEVAISRQLMAVRATTVDVNFLYAFLSTNLRHFQSLSTGAAIPGISREDVLGLMCPIPKVEEQQVTVKLIHALSDETQSLTRLYGQKLEALEALKKSILHEAFSGNL